MWVVLFIVGGFFLPWLSAWGLDALDRVQPDQPVATFAFAVQAGSAAIALAISWFLLSRTTWFFMAGFALVPGILLFVSIGYGGFGASLGPTLLYFYGGVVILLAIPVGEFIRAQDKPWRPTLTLGALHFWFAAWGIFAVLMLVTMPHQVAEAARANAPRNTSAVGAIVLVVLLGCAAIARRHPFSAPRIGYG